MSNKLANEKSPYLLEHAENPVDWYPWCNDAFEKAKREDKPVFLSIGYSTCHWCHVMARESFENTEVADILNAYYVSIKVDREERPDIDAVYMNACTAINGSGGWPLTVIMTPEQKPFYVGTYLPRESARGTLGLKALLEAIAKKWDTERRDLLNAGNEIIRFISKENKSSQSCDRQHLPEKAAEQLADSFDKENGGFGTAPKFPSPHDLLFLLRYAKLSGDKNARHEAEFTLQRMYRGGIYDHFGGGFARYSTDKMWLAPHFEKTLYDNALLAYTYAEAWQEGHFALYKTVAESTLDYCIRELRSPEGGYFCGQDADSDGKEGAYYLFRPDEVKSVLGDDDGRHFCECYDITDEGNFGGRSIPNLLVNDRWNLLPPGYAAYREKLRHYRTGRFELRTDTKILNSWNGLVLMALSKAAAVFNEPYYLEQAQALADFMEKSMFADGRLMARLCSGELKFPAQLDDYAYYALGLLELYRADFDPRHIIEAEKLADDIISHFADEKGGFFRTADDAERLIMRPKEEYDGALPSGNSAAAVLLYQLWQLTAEEKRRDEAHRQLDFICGRSSKYPAGFAFGLTMLLRDVYPSRELLCVSPDENVPEMLRTIMAKYSPEMNILLKTPRNGDILTIAAPFTAQCGTKDGNPTFYMCSNGQCSLPVTEL